ncbi:MAG TPA: efflux RND transporter permease subunit, partial [Opitutaceae bacterium]|nr:efflux RND transporter permease subunit [Opitutaceae bacterium]
VDGSIAFPGLSINGFTNSPSSGIVFVSLKPFEERPGKNLTGNAIAQELQHQFAEIQDAFIAIFPPPPVQGLGTISGFKLYVEDRGDNGLDALYGATQSLLAKASETPGLAGLFT